MAEPKDSCVKPSRGPIGASKAGSRSVLQADVETKEAKMVAQVGKQAPDFEAAAFVNGGFKNVTLSEFKGKWVALCFYPGDFTFV